MRSDLTLAEQVQAPGATWLDRRLVATEPAPLSENGFGRDVRDALEARTEHLISEGLARRQGPRVVFVRDLLDTLRNRELDSVGARITAETGLPRHAVSEGETVAGVYRSRLSSRQAASP